MRLRSRDGRVIAKEDARWGICRLGQFTFFIMSQGSEAVFVAGIGVWEPDGEASDSSEALAQGSSRNS